jgi:tRNA(Ile)-lysidine synthetase-like protein
MVYVDLLTAIRAAASELTPEERSAPILVGVSGGPDSLALLHALGRWRDEGGPAVAAIHVDHRLRPGSADEARQVAAWCAEWGVPFSGRAVAFERAPGANIEQAAREARYACFAAEVAASGARVLALAHHADDQAETLLLHLLRGAGLGGLAGMPVARRSGDLLDRFCGELGVARPVVWRPLLAVRRAAIVAYCERWRFTPIHDPSNDDTTLRRNAVRHRIIPLLEEYFPGASGTLARNAALLADDDAFLQRATGEAFERCAVREREIVILDRAAFRLEHPAMQRRLLRAVWAQLGGLSDPIGLDADAMEAARVAIAGGRTGTRQFLPGGLLLVVDREDAALGPAATLDARLRDRLGLPLVEPDWSSPLPAAGMLGIGAGWAIDVVRPGTDAERSTVIQIAADGGDSPVFRTWRPGDRVALAAGRGSRKLQDWFTDRHIPAYVRHHLPLLTRGDRVLWIVGLAIFPPVVPGAAAGEAIALRLLYNGSPVEPIRHR